MNVVKAESVGEVCLWDDGSIQEEGRAGRRGRAKASRGQEKAGNGRGQAGNRRITLEAEG